MAARQGIVARYGRTKAAPGWPACRNRGHRRPQETREQDRASVLAADFKAATGANWPFNPEVALTWVNRTAECLRQLAAAAAAAAAARRQEPGRVGRKGDPCLRRRPGGFLPRPLVCETVGDTADEPAKDMGALGSEIGQRPGQEPQRCKKAPGANRRPFLALGRGYSPPPRLWT